MPDSDRGIFAGTSLARHAARGAIGFGLLGSAFALAPSIGPATLLLAPAGLLALRGCPMCWTVGLVETVATGRSQHTCAHDGCIPKTLCQNHPDQVPTNGGRK